MSGATRTGAVAGLPDTASALLSALEPLSHRERWQYMINLGRRIRRLTTTTTTTTTTSSFVTAHAIAAADNSNNKDDDDGGVQAGCHDDDDDEAAAAANMQRILCELAASDDHYKSLVAVMGLRGILLTSRTSKSNAARMQPADSAQAMRPAVSDEVLHICLHLLTHGHPHVSSLVCPLIAQLAPATVITTTTITSEENGEEAEEKGRLYALLCANETQGHDALRFSTYVQLVRALRRSGRHGRLLYKAYCHVMCRPAPALLLPPPRRGVCLACALPSAQLVCEDFSLRRPASTQAEPTTASAAGHVAHTPAEGEGGVRAAEDAVRDARSAENVSACREAWWRAMLPRAALRALAAEHPRWTTHILLAALREERQQQQQEQEQQDSESMAAERRAMTATPPHGDDDEEKEDKEDEEVMVRAFCMSRALNAAIVTVLQTLPRAHTRRHPHSQYCDEEEDTTHTTADTADVGLPSSEAEAATTPSAYSLPSTPCELGLTLLQESMPYLRGTHNGRNNDDNREVLRQLLPPYLRCCPLRVCRAVLARPDLPWPTLRLSPTLLRTRLASETDLVFALATQGCLDDLPGCYRYLPSALRRRLYTTQRALLVPTHVKRGQQQRSNTNKNSDDAGDDDKKKQQQPLPMHVLRYVPDMAARQAEARAQWLTNSASCAAEDRAERCAPYLSLLPYDEAYDKLASLRRSAELSDRIATVRTLIGTIAYDAEPLVPLLQYCVARRKEQTAWHAVLWHCLAHEVPLHVWQAHLPPQQQQQQLTRTITTTPSGSDDSVAWTLLTELMGHTMQAIDVSYDTLAALQDFLVRCVAAVRPYEAAALLRRLLEADERLSEILPHQLAALPTTMIATTTATGSSKGSGGGVVVAAALFDCLQDTLTRWMQSVSSSSSLSSSSSSFSPRRFFALLDGLTASLTRAVKQQQQQRRHRERQAAQSAIHSATRPSDEVTKEGNDKSDEARCECALRAAKALYLACVDRFASHDATRSEDGEALRRQAEMALHAMARLFRYWPRETCHTLLPRLLAGDAAADEGTAKEGKGVCCGWVGMAQVRQALERDLQGRYLDRYLTPWSFTSSPTPSSSSPSPSPSVSRSGGHRSSNAARSAFFDALRRCPDPDIVGSEHQSSEARAMQRAFCELQTRHVPFSGAWARRWTAAQQQRYTRTLVHLLQPQAERHTSQDEGEGAEAAAVSLEQQRSMLRLLARMPATVAERDGLCGLARVAPGTEALFVRDLALRMLGRRCEDGTAVQELLRALRDERAAQALFALRRVVRRDGLRPHGFALERDVVRTVLARHEVGLRKELIRLLAAVEEGEEAYACLQHAFIEPAMAQHAVADDAPCAGPQERGLRQPCQAASAEDTEHDVPPSRMHPDVLLALLAAVQQQQLGRPAVWQLYEHVVQDTTAWHTAAEDKHVEACQIICNVPDALLLQAWQRRRYCGVLLQLLRACLSFAHDDDNTAGSKNGSRLLIAVLHRLSSSGGGDSAGSYELEHNVQETLLAMLDSLTTHYTEDNVRLVHYTITALLSLASLPARVLVAHVSAVRSDAMLREVVEELCTTAQYKARDELSKQRVRHVAKRLTDNLIRKGRQPRLAVQLLIQCLPCEQWTAALERMISNDLMHIGASSAAVHYVEELCERQYRASDSEPVIGQLEQRAWRHHAEPVLRRLGLAVLVCAGHARGWSDDRRTALQLYVRDAPRWVSDDAALVSVGDEAGSEG